jgi:hypothetical protein
MHDSSTRYQQRCFVHASGGTLSNVAGFPALTARAAHHYAGVSPRRPKRVFIVFPARPVRLIVVMMLGIALHAAGNASSAEQRANDASFRVFLRDGTAVVTYGDFARVGERIIFLVAIGSGGPEHLQVVNLPLSSVDLAKTEQYALAVRAARYAATEGEADYAVLTASVAKALNRVAATNSPLERVQIVEQVRGVVATWTRDHYGYRANDIRQIQALLDEVVSDLRADAGVNQFDLNLVAGVEPPAAPALPKPTPAEAIEQVLRVARASDVAADRLALLRAALRVLERPSPGMSGDWLKRTRNAAYDAIAEEVRMDRAYRDLAWTAVARALAAASRADAPGVEEVLDDIRRRDVRLGRKRPDEVAGLVASVQDHLEAARRLRLARDRWRLRYPMLRDYQDLVRRPMQQLAGARKSLDAIRRLSGPDPEVLARLRERLGRANQMVLRIAAPADVAGVHATLISACQLALRSADIRERAIESGDLQLAWNAASAAAGAMMLLAQARDQLQAALRPPELK